MTWLLKLTRLPLADAKSKRHHCRKKFKKLKKFPQTWLSSKNYLKISDNEKNENFTIGMFASENDQQEHKGPQDDK